MLFASLTFLYIFLPVTLVVYFLVPNLVWKNGVLIFASLLFYAWGEPIWTFLLILSAGVDYIHARVIEANRGKPIARLMVASSLLINLGVLVAFKYSGFIGEAIGLVTGIDPGFQRLVLPLGISFYTFQTISYTIDVYRDKVPAQRSFMKFLLYVSLFPQLVAGPIVRYSHVAAAIERRSFNLKIFASGLSRFAIGLAKKVVIANNAGALAVPFLDGDLGSLTVTGAWWGIFMFAIQIYFDFSGYSDMAIGLGRMFGFEYRENFRYPYISASVQEFWRRWHISLGRFFRDYVYIPLGGNRKHYILNLFVVWFLTGLWHGAYLNFILWGLYYGLWIGLERLTNVLSDKVLGGYRIPRVLGLILMIPITLIGWGLFYYTDLERGLQFFTAFFGVGGADFTSTQVGLAVQANILFAIVAIICATPIHSLFWKLVVRLRRVIPVAYGLAKVGDLGLVIISTGLLIGSTYNPFLYFRF